MISAEISIGLPKCLEIAGKLLLFFGFEVRREIRAFAEEVFFAFGHPVALAVFAHQVESEFVDEHFGVFEPHSPGGFGHVVEDACAEGAFERGFIESF